VLETVLEDGEERGDAILAVVEKHDSAFGVKGLADVELNKTIAKVEHDQQKTYFFSARTFFLRVHYLVVRELAQDGLDSSSSVGLEAIYLICWEFGRDRLHVALDVSSVALLVKASRLKAIRKDDVVDLLSAFFITTIVISSLSRGIGTDVDFTSTLLDGDSLAIDFQDGTRFLDWERVGEKLVADYMRIHRHEQV